MVDLKTYRFKGHSMSDPRKYRTRDEEEQWEADDPITRLRDAMYGGGLLDEAGFKALGKEQKLLKEADEDEVEEIYFNN